MTVKKFWRALLAAVALFIGTEAAHAQAQLYGIDNPNRILNRYIVVLNDKTPWASGQRGGRRARYRKSVSKA